MNHWIDLQRLENNDLPLPKVSTKYSAGMDFAACLTRPGFVIDGDCKEPYITHGPLNKPMLSVRANQTVLIPLGFKCQFSEECVLQIFIRSSLAVNGFMLANSTAIIDSDYRGEIFACLYNRLELPLNIEHGQRIVQGMLIKLEHPIIRETDSLEISARGTGGFGSTGKI